MCTCTGDCLNSGCKGHSGVLCTSECHSANFRNCRNCGTTLKMKGFFQRMYDFLIIHRGTIVVIMIGFLLAHKFALNVLQFQFLDTVSDFLTSIVQRVLSPEVTVAQLMETIHGHHAESPTPQWNIPILHRSDQAFLEEIMRPLTMALLYGVGASGKTFAARLGLSKLTSPAVYVPLREQKSASEVIAEIVQVAFKMKYRQGTCTFSPFVTVFHTALDTWRDDKNLIKQALCEYAKTHHKSLILFLDNVHALGESTPTRDSFVSWLLLLTENRCVRVLMMTSDELFAQAHLSEACGVSNRLRLIHIPPIPEGDIVDYLTHANLDADNILKTYGSDIVGIGELVHTVQNASDVPAAVQVQIDLYKSSSRDTYIRRMKGLDCPKITSLCGRILDSVVEKRSHRSLVDNTVTRVVVEEAADQLVRRQILFWKPRKDQPHELVFTRAIFAVIREEECA